MATARIPGPQVGWPPVNLDKGTSCRNLSPIPGPIGIDKKGTVFSSKSVANSNNGITSSSNVSKAPTKNQSLRIVQPISLTFYGKHEALIVIASLENNASDDTRQKAIDILVKEHAIDLSTTKSLLYDKNFAETGQNKDGYIRIGPKAYSRSTSWLAHIIFHETVHSDQFAFYSSIGIDLTALKANQNNSEPLRLLYALDEVECWFVSWSNRVSLGMSPQEITDIKSEYRRFSMDLDDAAISQLANTKHFSEARKMLISRLH